MKLSPMTLGTVQLGMNYGIANQNGKPKEETSFAILKAALEGGVKVLDTARAYGDSEEVIGRFLKQWKGEKPAIITKIPKLKGDTPQELERFAVESAEASLERLGVDRLDGILLHGSQDPLLHKSACAKAMQSLLDRGYTDRVGVSVYTAEEIEGMLSYDVFSLTQIPMNLFDQSLLKGGYPERLKERGYDVFVRSVFWQGLFFLDPDRVTDPDLIRYAVPHIRLLRSFAEENGCSVPQLAIGFIRQCVGVSSLVLGADTPEQVRTNLSYFDTPLPDESLMACLREAFPSVSVPEIMKVLSRPKQ